MLRYDGGCLERIDVSLIAPKYEHETLMFAAHHHATHEAILLPEHRQRHVVGEALVDTHALGEQSSCPESCEHKHFQAIAAASVCLQVSLKSRVSERLLTIGELARRAGVATSAVRYWEQLGLLPAPERIWGQRRYSETAVAQVGVILLLRDAGFTLAEQQSFLASHGIAVDEWRRLARRKLAEIDEHIAKAQAAREAIEHALRCPHEDIRKCATFRSLVTARLVGQPLLEAHRH